MNSYARSSCVSACAILRIAQEWGTPDIFFLAQILSTECPSCRSESNYVKIQARNINTTHYDLDFSFRTKKTQTNLFENWEMDDETSTSWQGHGATVTYQSSSYSNGGYLITGRTETFHGIKYEFTQSDVVNMRNRNSFYSAFSFRL